MVWTSTRIAKVEDTVRLELQHQGWTGLDPLLAPACLTIWTPNHLQPHLHSGRNFESVVLPTHASRQALRAWRASRAPFNRVSSSLLKDVSVEHCHRRILRLRQNRLYPLWQGKECVRRAVVQASLACAIVSSSVQSPPDPSSRTSERSTSIDLTKSIEGCCLVLSPDRRFGRSCS